MSKTIICDIDGCILHHRGEGGMQHLRDLEILNGVREAFSSWDKKGYNIILISGRRESSRKKTEEQLIKAGLFWDQLILGVKGHPRYLINDKKPSGQLAAYSYNLDRNKGFSEEIINL